MITFRKRSDTKYDIVKDKKKVGDIILVSGVKPFYSNQKVNVWMWRIPGMENHTYSLELENCKNIVRKLYQ